jgi:hypothetical protein
MFQAMKMFKKMLRIVGLAILILLALSGVGMGNIFSTRERYMNKEVRTEQTDKKEREQDELGDEIG